MNYNEVLLTRVKDNTALVGPLLESFFQQKQLSIHFINVFEFLTKLKLASMLNILEDVDLESELDKKLYKYVSDFGNSSYMSTWVVLNAAKYSFYNDEGKILDSIKTYNDELKTLESFLREEINNSQIKSPATFLLDFKSLPNMAESPDLKFYSSYNDYILKSTLVGFLKELEVI